MKKYLLILFCLSLISCDRSDVGVILKKNEVSIIDSNVHFYGIVLSINETEMIPISSDKEDKTTIVHYKNPGGKEIDLIFKTNSNDSLLFYHISARLTERAEWLATDTLKVYFSTSDSIKAGLYSVRYSPVYCWTKPVSFEGFNQIEKSNDIQFAYWQYTNNTYAAAMPLGGNGFAFSLAKDNKGFGAIGMTGFNAEIDGEIPMLSITIGTDFYKLIPSTFRYSFKEMGIQENLREQKTKPDMYNYLGYATWNAYKHSVNEAKIMNSAKSFKAAQIPVKWFLIDDGWLDITDNKLNAFTPDKEKFPAAFMQMNDLLKKKYGINNIGVWHTLNGYWEGLSESGKLANDFNDFITYSDKIPWLSETSKAFRFVNPFADDGCRFYDNWYKYLSEQGIAFVKVDNQLVVKKLAEGNFSYWSGSDKVFDNLHSAAKKYFNSSVINCMGMLNNDFYHYKNTSIARTVEDYNPENDTNLFSCEFNGNAAAHIIASVQNSVWLSNIVWPDYDMFQSNDKDAWYYAIAKVMSNGPVYITDEPGKHNVKLLKSISFDDGKVINSDKPALPTEDCIFQLFDSEKPFKVFSTYKNNGLLAAWNVSDKDSVNGVFAPSSIRGLYGKQFLVFEFFSKSIYETGLNNENPIRLDRMGCKFFSVIPLVYDKAVIGDISKVIPMAAVSNVEVSEKSIQLEVNEESTLWIYSKSKPASMEINGAKIETINYTNNILAITIEENNSRINVTF